MKILLVKPAFARLLDNTVYLTYPLGLMYVAAMLRARGHDVRIWHDDVSNTLPIGHRRPDFQPLVIEKTPSFDVLEPFIAYLDTFRPDVVGVGYTTIDRTGSHAIAHAAQSRGIRTVAGGIHPSLLPNDELKPDGPFDAVVIGDGDHEGVACAFEWGVDDASGGPRAPFTAAGEDQEHSLFDRLFPARDAVIGWERYVPYLRGVFQTQRGCPYNCGYCAAPKVFGRRVRTRDPQHVRAEIETLGVRHGRNIDDSFFVHKQHGRDVCRELEGSGFTWVCDMAMQDATDEALDCLVRGGCTTINCGIESATPKWREFSGKQVDDAKPGNLLMRASTRGLGVHYYFMIGFPGETYGEIQATLDLAEKLRDCGAVPCISLVTPYPKTRLWAAAVQWTGSENEEWSMSIHQNSTVKLAACSDAEWEAALERGNRINP